MPIIQVPESLREKLGDKASEGLVSLIRDSQEEQKSHLLELVEERFARRVLESQMILRKEMHDGFLRVEEKFSGMQSQITSQTRWLIALITFIAGTFKLIDLFLK